MTILVSLLLAVQLPAVQAVPRTVETEVRDLQIVASRGDVKASRQALERAVEGKPVAERAVMQIAVADVLARSSDAASMQEAESLYVESLKSGRPILDPNRRLRTENNYAALLLRTGRTDAARLQLESMREPMRKQPPEAQSRYLHNYARALERTDPLLALKLYDEALSVGPVFEDTARAASSLALNAPSESVGIPATVALVSRLLTAGQFPLAQEHLLKASTMPRWIGHPQYPQILASVARFLATAKVDRAGFTRVWDKPLAEGARVRKDAQVRYDDLRRAFLPPGIELVFEPALAKSRFSAWLTTDTEAAALVSLLHEVGRQARVEGATDDALSRLASAWAFSRTAGPIAADAGMAAAVDLTSLLLAAGPDLGARTRVLDEMVAQLFEGKGQAYAGRDYASALRFHLLLGSIFERQKRWGPPSNPHSALFQWQLALKDHDLLRATGRPGDLSEVPGLHLRLAKAWEEVGDRSNALRALLNAADGYLALKRGAPASNTLARARPLSSFGGPAEQRRLTMLEQSAAALPR